MITTEAFTRPEPGDPWTLADLPWLPTTICTDDPFPLALDPADFHLSQRHLRLRRHQSIRNGVGQETVCTGRSATT
jgi:hypothetical protein